MCGRGGRSLLSLMMKIIEPKNRQIAIVNFDQPLLLYAQVYASRGHAGVHRSPLQPEETHSLTRSDDISRMLPSEAHLLAASANSSTARSLDANAPADPPGICIHRLTFTPSLYPFKRPSHGEWRPEAAQEGLTAYTRLVLNNPR